jgi:hypothetical protein
MADRLQARMKELADEFAERYCEESTLGRLRAIWQSDRHSDYKAFHRTASYVAEQLLRIGVRDVEIVPCPADGVTRCQAWTMPLAWEGGAAVLKMVAPHEEVLCDRSAEPLSCGMWSEPTPPGGVRGPLVVLDDPDSADAEMRRQLRGAIILTGKSARGPIKVFASEVGAAAVVSHFVARVERHPEAVGWSNGWSDDAGGWALKASDCRMTIFQIAPPVGQRLRQMLDSGPITCEASVGGRIAPGVLPVVTGVLGGDGPEELLLTGHLYEIGAVDNASGCAAMLESLRIMAGMPRPRRRVRALFTSECYGTYAFYTERSQLLARTLAGLNLDCVGEAETDEHPALWARTSEAAPSAVDSVLRAAMAMTEGLPGALPADERGHALSDNMLCDPMAGVPMPCFMKAPWHWHCSADDWSGISPEAMRRATVATAAALRWLAEARPADADALAEAALADALRAYPEGSGMAPRRREFFLDRGRARVLWTNHLGATRAEETARELPALALSSLVTEEDGGEEERATVPVRSFWGAPTFDEMPQAERQGMADPRWNSPLIAASYWANGRRSVAEIAALVRTEYDQPMADLLGFFCLLERGGLVKLERRG